MPSPTHISSNSFLTFLREDNLMCPQDSIYNRNPYINRTITINSIFTLGCGDIWREKSVTIWFVIGAFGIFYLAIFLYLGYNRWIKSSVFSIAVTYTYEVRTEPSAENSYEVIFEEDKREEYMKSDAFFRVSKGSKVP